MVDSPDVNPNAQPPKPGMESSKTQPKTAFNASQKKHEGWAKPMHWLGMDFTAEQAKQLWTIISQSISTQIQKEQQRAIKALRKLRSDDPDQNNDS